ncbi:unnamed protein product [Caenorhabditis sp. 36 PRJEB53466]|nr:unnamed protein product [Caenorhabditis sp. 36 PRJEB53466]
MSLLTQAERDFYRPMYEALKYKNLTFEEYAAKQVEIQQKYRNSVENYTLLVTIGAPYLHNIELEPISLMKAVRRLIVIDGPNVMHGGSIYADTREGAVQHNIPDVAALLSLMRFFVVRSFDVFAVISRKYTYPDATNFKEAIDMLVKNNLCIVAPNTNLDDVIALEFASQVNGIVLTTDKYRDHAEQNARYLRLSAENRMNIRWDFVAEKMRNTRSREHSDYVSNKKFAFVFDEPRPDDGRIEMTPAEILQRIYVSPDNMQYEISKERYELSKPEKKKEQMLSVLNSLIIDGISVCKANVERINREVPVFDPSAQDNQQDEEDFPDYVDPVDEQADFISPADPDADEDWG